MHMHVLKRITAFLAAAMLLGLMSLSAAQDKPANNKEIVHEKLKADKKVIVSKYMDLTESEAKNFWPVYDEYQKDLQQDRPTARIAPELCRRLPKPVAHRRKSEEAVGRVDHPRKGRRQAAEILRSEGAESVAGEEGSALPADRKRVPHAAELRPRGHRAVGSVGAKIKRS